MHPNIQLEKQNIRPLKGNEISQEKPRIGQGSTGMRRRKSPINQTIIKTSETSKKIPEASKIEKKIINNPDFTMPVQLVNNPNVEAINRRPIIKDIPFYPGPTYRPPLKLIRIPSSESPENMVMSPFYPDPTYRPPLKLIRIPTSESPENIDMSPLYPDPTYRPPLKLIRIPTSESPENIDMSPELNFDFEDNSPF